MKRTTFALFAVLVAVAVAREAVEEDLLELHAITPPISTIDPAQRERVLQESLAVAVPHAQLRGAVTLTWPVRVTDTSYAGHKAWAISNYPDHNAQIGAVRDYECGTRSYDLGGTTPYNHQGTDIFLTPFPWAMKANGSVSVVAAAPGVLASKGDGADDSSCVMCTGGCDANYATVRHADGSVGLYWHMKKGSVTTKSVGAAIARGEVLGKVASSGMSTGPHLHFELNVGTAVVDPWKGPCNNIAASWWLDQQPYVTPDVLDIYAATASPNLPQCSTETSNRLAVYPAGTATVMLVAFVRDLDAGQSLELTLSSNVTGVLKTWASTAATSFMPSTYISASYTLAPAERTGSYKITVKH
jgi:murein DD-endopeptidase MepM/ murein hydrolase activator NlpD